MRSRRSCIATASTSRWLVAVPLRQAWPGRYRRDYVNCPLDETEYRAFVEALCAGAEHEFKQWETSTPYFEGCLPIEVMAERGADTLRFGPMKPVGLVDPRTGRRPFAVVQLRQDNALGTLFNMVGFQTKLTYGDQKRMFRMIPGLEPPSSRAWAACTATPSSTARACSTTAAAQGHAARPLRRPDHRGRRLRRERGDRPSGGPLRGRRGQGEPVVAPPSTTALGALLAHITRGADAATFQPMNINFGLFPPLDQPVNKSERKPALARRALAELDAWLARLAEAA